MRPEGRYRLAVLVASACFGVLWVAGLFVLAYDSTLLGVSLMVIAGMGLAVVLVAGSRRRGTNFRELIGGILGELFGWF